MLVTLKNIPMVTSESVVGELSTLNSIWYGDLRNRIMLPQLGHLLLVFPLGETSISCNGISIGSSQYIFLSSQSNYESIPLENLDKEAEVPVLVLWLGPMFIKDMASFLSIPTDLENLLHNIPLSKGDITSALLIKLAEMYSSNQSQDILEDLCFEIIGEIIGLLRIRQQAIKRLSIHKNTTIEDLLPKLLQARQYVESRFVESFKIHDVAKFIGLSEFHFTRLYKVAFGITLHQHLIQLRLDNARQLLETSSETITNIALQTGYSNLSSFIHAFSKRFELSPSQYQNRYKISKI
jgi:AraC-like DNA-binding protein